MMRVLAMLGAFAAGAATAASAAELMPGGNAGTLARSFALPALGAPQRVRAGAVRLTYDVANEYVAEGDCDVECIRLDGETSRVRLAWRGPLGRGWDAGMTVPFLWQGGGYLDGWIRDWHSAFGLPTGGREQVADGGYAFRYRGPRGRLEATTAGSGLGDVELTLGRSLGARATLRALAKLPTGDEGMLRGGNGGAALWLDARLPLPARWDGYVAAGASYNGRGELLPELQRREVYFGGAGLVAPLAGPVALHAQLYAHTPLYDGSVLTPLRRPGLPFTLGLRFATGAGSAFELGFQEDPSVNGSPDFVAYLSLVP